MAAPPRLAFLLAAVEVDEVFAPTDRARLDEIATIIDPAPLKGLDDPRASDLLGAAEILVTGWGCPRLDEAALGRAPKLKLIAHAAGSARGFMSPAVFARGIRVVTAADANAVPVAEYTLAMILLANKRAFSFSARYRAERRGLEVYLRAGRGVGNWQKTVGIVGASRIGRRVLDLLRRHDFMVLLTDPFIDAEAAAALGAKKVELETLLAESDVVSLHAPSLSSTRHMLDARRLALMREGATLINTARGALIDQAALIDGLERGRISAVLDVTDPDVLPPDSRLYDLPNVFLTPHIAGAAGDERRRFGQLIVGEIERFNAGTPLLHELTPETYAWQA